MSGNIDKNMAQGIAQTKGVIVFLTRKYHQKVDEDNAGDNCQKEFLSASRKKTRSSIVAVVKEKCMRNTNAQSRLVDFYLGGKMYIDMSGDFKNKTYLTQEMELLVKELHSKGIHPPKASYVLLTEKAVVHKYLNRHFEMIIMISKHLAKR